MIASPALALGPSWLNAETLLQGLGGWALLGAALVIFAECGLLIGFFLPGDSLLFTVGVLVGTNVIGEPLWVACLALTLAAFLGNVVGYEIGRFAGPRLFAKEDSRLFKREYVVKTEEFFAKYGARAIVLARFVPIVRTFITVTAGIARLDRRYYLTYSALGAVLWATGVTLLGHEMGKIQFVKDNVELILILAVLLSLIPVIIEVIKDRAKARRAV